MVPVTPPVPKELQRLLDRTYARLPEDRSIEVQEMFQGEALPSAYQCCIWYDGCYYCKGEDNLWRTVHCGV
jgi:hypothetical protein